MGKMIDRLFEAFDSGEASASEKGAMDAAQPIIEKTREKLTRKELDELWSAIMDIGTADVESSFARGFRLGARLMLEVLAEG